MSKAGKRLITVIIWAGIGVLIGMQLGAMNGDMATKEPAFGWVQQGQEDDLSELEYEDENAAPQSSVKEAPEPKFEPVPRDILLPESSKPAADVLADKTAGLLQQLSNQSIRWVVSIFDSIVD
ncbi:hypothetical protein [Paenibacillus faecalis]|uniref:hypothetical protein n=1 Tax=Paenibacillus faecalis TaxID=2079532 RepID=UPI000D0E51D8|nr:hypothetical protein [Paenibacillus faecalis]